MLILGIETSCDDTAIAVLEVKNQSRRQEVRAVKMRVLSNIVSSQVKLHAKYGGVFPSLAAREHEKNLPKVLKLALKEAKTEVTDIDLVTVTKGPGLEPSLWRGVNFANNLAKKFKKPILGVNHLEGHIYSNWLKPVGVKSKIQTNNDKIFPALCLIVSGGHTELVIMKNYGKYKLIGETLDDAVGEAFDKVARILGLGYPGGPIIALKTAKFSKSEIRPLENSRAKSRGSRVGCISDLPQIKFPRPMINSKDFNFSFSGLKTAVLYKTREFKKLTPKIVNQICYEFQEAATDVLISKTIKAAEKYKVKSVMLSGGVSANKLLRERLSESVKTLEPNTLTLIPDMTYTTDNAAMIALAGYFNRQTKTGSLSWKPVKPNANLNF